MSGQTPHELYLKIRTFLSRWGWGIAFAWGLLEATVFFVIPDVFLAFSALFYPMIGVIFCVVSIAGSLAGGTIMYFLGQYHPGTAFELLTFIPGISEKMIAYVNNGFDAQGLKTMFVAPWEGIPYKIYAVQSAIHKIPFFVFLLASIPARLERFVLAVLIALGFGKFFGRNIATYPLRWLSFYLILWVLIYTKYIYSLQQRWGG